MADIELVIKISEEKFNAIKSKMYCGIYDADLYKAIVNGIPLPKGHGRLIDADTFISQMEDTSKRQKYKELLIDDCLTVDTVFKAVIESLRNEGLANGDAPTIVEADRAESEDKA